MHISKEDEAALRERLKKTDGGIRSAAALAGITERVVQKLLSGDNVRQQTYDAFINGLEQVEELELQRRKANSLRAQGMVLAAA